MHFLQNLGFWHAVLLGMGVCIGFYFLTVIAPIIFSLIVLSCALIFSGIAYIIALIILGCSSMVRKLQGKAND